MHTSEEIRQALHVRPHIDARTEIERRVQFLVDYALTIPTNRGFVLGISGGQDSTLAGKLAQLAADRLKQLGHERQFTAVRLPYGEQHDEADAQLALEFIAPDVTLTVQIRPSVDATVASIVEATGEPVTDFSKGNIKARQRMIVQYGIAGDRGLLVVGSDHAAEAITGYFTKFGDGAADVMPLAGLTKEQGRELLREMEATPRLYEKLPTADLLDDQPGDLDEDSLGVQYTHIDDFLTGTSVDASAVERITQLYARSQHKRNLPVTPNDDWWKNQ